MSLCNRCRVDELVRDNPGGHVFLVFTTTPSGEPDGGVDVYVVPAGEKLQPHRDEYWVAWCMELTEKCAC